MGEIEAVTSLGLPVGVVSGRVYRDKQILEVLQRTESPVFIDSGAFGEVMMTRDGLIYPPSRALSDQQWMAHIHVGSAMRCRRGETLWVAPDRVGDHAGTMRRLRRWRRHMAAILCSRVTVLVVLQTGGDVSITGDDIAYMWRQVEDVISPCVPALPAKRAGVSVRQARDFIAATGCRRLHLLGGRDAMGCEVARGTACVVSTDTVPMRAAVGRRSGRARLLTRIQDTIRERMWAEISGIPDAYMDDKSWILRCDRERVMTGEISLLDAYRDYMCGVLWRGRVRGGRPTVRARKREALRLYLTTRQRDLLAGR